MILIWYWTIYFILILYYIVSSVYAVPSYPSEYFEYKYRQATIESQLISTKPSACDNKCLGHN